MTYTYEFADATGAHEEADPFEELRGIFKDVFAALGGGENFIKAERAAFEESLRKEER